MSRYFFPSPAGGPRLGPLFSVDNLLQIANLQHKWVLREGMGKLEFGGDGRLCWGDGISYLARYGALNGL